MGHPFFFKDFSKFNKEELIESDIPALLSTKLGIKYDENNLEKTINDLYYLILKKLKYLKKINQLVLFF